MTSKNNGGSNNGHAHEGQSLLPTTRTTSSPEEIDDDHHQRGMLKAIFFTGIALASTAILILFLFQSNKDGSMIAVARDKKSNWGRHGSGPISGMDSPSESHFWWEHDNVNVSEINLSGGIPHVVPKDTNRPLRWGILGLGRIARDFTTALKMSGAHISAVAAGSLPDAEARAREFAEIYAVPRSYGSYEELAADPKVDIVYVATINTLHHNNTILMLQGGKNVLLEKPMAVTYQEAKAMAAEAKLQNRLLQVNHWTRFFPVVKHVRSVLASQELGTIVAMHGDFGFPAPPDPSSDRFLQRHMGGGSMLDLGCYLVDLAIMVNPNDNYPADIEAIAQKTYLGVDYGVDTEMSFILKWDDSNGNYNNETLVMTGMTSFRRPSSFEVEIGGTHGRLVIHTPANAPNATTIYKYEPYGPLKNVKIVRSEMPEFDLQYGPPKYPRGAGFVYIIQGIEECMNTQGIPGATADGEGCLELEQVTMAEQLRTAKITYKVMEKAGYRSWK